MEESASTVLELRAWGVSFGSRVILSCIDLCLPPTGIDVLMGPVKAGKSTLMRSLAGLNQSNSAFRSWGEALLQGRTIGDGWRPLLVQQHAAILNCAVRDAVIYRSRQHIERSAAAWTAHAHDVLCAHGLSKQAASLSDPMLSLPVERQRAVNILSHALSRPSLLMIDEPTYGLDDLAAGWLVEWLIELGRSTRLMVALHHQGQARRMADRICLLGGGRVLAYESSSNFFAGTANAWVEQFVRSGSIAIASPDAKPEDLGPEVEPPPPLPAAALASTAPFKQAIITAKPLPPPSPPQPTSMRSAEPVAPMPSTTAKLPPLSRHGVADASMVGAAMLSAYRGPQGFYWIVPGKLAGCAEPGAIRSLDYDLDLLCRMGVTRLITLTEKDLDVQALAQHGLQNVHLPVFDREAPSIRQTYMLMRRMQVLMDEGQVVAVHCKAGVGRTGTILAAWMIREGGIGATVAIERLRRINPAYVQTVAQEQFLRDFEQDILKRM